MNIIDRHINKIKDLCEKHNVVQFFVFGSALTDKFDDNSDIDLVVDFDKVELDQYADNYFNLKQALEQLFKRKVDLLEQKAIKNPFLRKSIDNSKQLIYG